MNMKHLLAYRPGWDWKGMLGSAPCLKWGFRDLRNLDAALAYTTLRRTCIQAGGNIGLFPKRLAEVFDVVYTFEPDGRLYNQLRVNAPEKNIKAHMAALGDSREGVTMRCSRRDDSGRAVHEGLTHVAGSGDVPQILIDDLAITDCDLIYLDIEGYELKALSGAVETIQRSRPVVGVEVNGASQHYGSSREQVRAFFNQQGYKLVLRQHSDEIYVPASHRVAT